MLLGWRAVPRGAQQTLQTADSADEAASAASLPLAVCRLPHRMLCSKLELASMQPDAQRLLGF